MPDNVDRGREEQHHPKLSPEEDKTQRGTLPSDQRAHRPDKLPPVDKRRRAEVEAHIRQWMERKGRVRQDGIWPYLLIRAVVGDHGVRPIPNNVAFWESPDIHVVEGDVPSLTGHPTTLHPRAGVPHSVFVHAWNIGKLASLGTSVTVYWANPTFSFTDPAHPPHLIGAIALDLPDRLSPNCHRVVRIPQLWVPAADNGARHECLLARIKSFTDGAGAGFDARTNRHIGQRNLDLIDPATDTSELLKALSAALPLGAELHLTHGMGHVKEVLAAHQVPLAARLVAPTKAPARAAVLADGRVHLGALVDIGANTVRYVPPTVFADSRHAEIDRKMMVDHRTSTISVAVKRDAAGRRSAPRLDLAAHLISGLGISDFRGGTIATALGGEPNTAHLLRFEARQGGVVIGGYSIIVAKELAR